jgi:eukaryotic-like serine/threonine-protein kinase
MPLTEGASRGGKPQTFLESKYTIEGGQFSPDGRYISYQSRESDNLEIYVVPYPGPGRREQISTEGGSTARWAHNGRELFYRNGGKMMVVDIQTSPVFRAGKPRLLFERPERDVSASYDVAPDGRFLMFRQVNSAAQEQPNEVGIVLNWAEELRRRVPVDK